MIKSSFTADFFELKPVPERVVGTVTSWFLFGHTFPLAF